MNYTKYEMMNKALEIFGGFGDDEELGPADWPTVKTYIASLSDIEGEQSHPHTQSHSDNKLDVMNLEDIRIRFLNGNVPFLFPFFVCTFVEIVCTCSKINLVCPELSTS